MLLFIIIFFGNLFHVCFIIQKLYFLLFSLSYWENELEFRLPILFTVSNY